MRLEHWTVIPFQVNHVISELRDLDARFRNKDWRPVPNEELPQDYLGDNLRGWSIEDGTTFFCINTQGFGVIVHRANHLDHLIITPDSVVDLLERRRKFHREAISNLHDKLVPWLHQITAAVDALHDRMGRPHSGPRREDLFDGFPYVLSIFILSRVRSPSEPHFRKCLSALIEPSLVGMDHEPHFEETRSPAEMARAIEHIPLEPFLYRDYDIDTSTSSYMSWPGVVILSQSHDEEETRKTRQLYLWLEIRTQLAWSMAYYSRLWCGLVLAGGELDEETAAEIQFRVSPILHQANTLRDKAVSSRFRLALSGLEESSGLSRQIAAADEALLDVQSYRATKSSLRGRRDAAMVDIVLMLIAAFQIFPFFFDMPAVPVAESPLSWLGVFLSLLLLALFVWRRRNGSRRTRR